MFLNAKDFNWSIGGWDVAAVWDMNAMFYLAGAFNQNLSGWCVPLIPGRPNMFDDGAGAWDASTPRPQWGGCFEF
jgi:hypothetical protein